MRKAALSIRVRVCARGAASAFTLVEMLAVMAIIALMVAVLLPSLSRSVSMARSAVCMSNLRQIGTGLQLYRIDFDGWLPRPAEDSHDPEAPTTPWFSLLFPTYINEPMVLACREDPLWYWMSRGKGSPGSQEAPTYSSYGMNSFIARSYEGYLMNMDRYRPTRLLDTILLADAGPDYPSSMDPDGDQDSPRSGGGLIALSDFADPLADWPGFPWITTRHNKRGINVLTLGGNIREARTKELMDLPVQSYYTYCAAGGCTLCSWSASPVDHYSFARSQLFWWTGTLPPPPVR